MARHFASPQNDVIGRPPNFWLFSRDLGFDLTHPATPDSPPVFPRLTIQTTNSPVTIAPAKTAIVIVDMMNYFLSPAFGRPKASPGLKAEEILLNYTIPAARKAGIQLIWITWGFSNESLETLTPTIWRIFGYRDDANAKSFSIGNLKLHNKEDRSEGGIGDPLGTVKLEDGSTIDAGRMFMRNQWNTELHDPLLKAYKEGIKSNVPDARFYKERLSALWENSGEMDRFLRARGIRTLLFSGVNSDQCVLATIQDANHKGYDTILLKDSSATNSPDFARLTVELNCQRSWGFMTQDKSLFDASQEAFDTDSSSAGARMKGEL